MENLERLIHAYSQDKRSEAIANYLKGANQEPKVITGLRGAQASFVLAGTYLIHSQRMVFIAKSKEEAAYTHNSLQNILPQKAVLFFPDSFKRAGKFSAIHPINVQQRSEVLDRLSRNLPSAEIVITYPEALVEQAVRPEVLAKNQLRIKRGEQIRQDQLIETLGELNFEWVDFVYEPGQYAVRGGIVDIFSFGNEVPYRVELFGDDVERINTFNPITQRSEKEIGWVSIVPNINTSFVKNEKSNLLESFDQSSSIWISDTVDYLKDRLMDLFEAVQELDETLQSDPEEGLNPEVMSFSTPGQVISQLEQFKCVHLVEKSDKALATFSGSPQPSFNKRFEILIKDLQEKARNGYEIFIHSENPKQIERFHSIFEDLKADVIFHPVNAAIHEGFIDHDLKLLCYTDHQIFERYHKYRVRKGFSREQAVNMKMLRELKPGDFITHIDHGIGQYSGLELLEVGGKTQESVRLKYKGGDVLYVSINALHKISKYIGKEGKVPVMHRLGSDAWSNLKRRTKGKVKDIAKDLIKLYAKRKASKGHAFPPDDYLQSELEASFFYEDTPDQLKATVAVKEDMQKSYPMDRLICGDVGFGKTEIAVRAAFKAVVGGKQVAILVPTTILALQHFKTFSERLKEFGVTVDYLNRFRTTAQRRAIMQRASEGKIDILIGTHALLNKKMAFKDLGLLVIDEEQKFGVAAKEKLRNLKVNVDTLTLTATPIPRTLQFSLMAARDLSIIQTPPPNRQPIDTQVCMFDDQLIKEAIYFEVSRGGQVFFVHNRVKSLPEIAGMIQRLCGDVDIAMAHGQMDSGYLEKTLVQFIDGAFDVLVCTNIIETGLDIPNANTIIIHNAHQFGLSDLHQLRGRVGRSNRKASCYLFCPPLSTLSPDSRKRLKTLEEFSELGSGFQIAMRDLDIRGAGNLLGAEQSGFIADIGFETYQKILDEAMQELKEREFRDLFEEELKSGKDYVRDVHIETDVEMLLPTDYVNSIQERLNLYAQLDKIEDEKALLAFTNMLKDRFGPIPKPTAALFDGLRLRWLCKQLGFEKLVLKKKKLHAYFVANPKSPYYDSDMFKYLMSMVAGAMHTGIRMKQIKSGFMLICPSVLNMKDAHFLLSNWSKESSGQTLDV